MTKTEFILEKSGEIIRRDITERAVDVGESIVNSLSANVDRIVKFAFQTRDPSMMVHLRACADANYWTVEMPRIVLRTSFKMDRDHLVPNFSGDGIDMPLFWTPPSSCKLAFMVIEKMRTSSSRWLNFAYLFAINSDNRCYRLPLANIYADCKLCLGEFESTGATSHAVILKALDQFDKSEWNSDLWRQDENGAHTMAMFRFKPEGDNFVQVMPENWTALCQKVATPMCEKVVL